MIETIRIADLTVLRAAAPVASRPPVLFVHGYFASATIWKGWLEYFAARGVDAYAVNLSGRSGSRPDADLGRLSIADYTDDAATVLSRVGAVAVVGHSMGGLVAQRLAELGRVEAAVLVTPAPPLGITVLSPRLAIRQLRYLPAILRSRPVHPGRGDLLALVLNHVPAGQQDELLDTLVPDSGRAGREMSITGVPVDPHRVRCPLLVIGAEDDRFIPHHIAARIAELYHASFISAPGHGHMVIVEPGWQQLADTVERWIREHAQGASTGSRTR